MSKLTMAFAMTISFLNRCAARLSSGTGRAAGLDCVVITGGLKRVGWRPQHSEGSDQNGLRRTAYAEETSREL